MIPPPRVASVLAAVLLAMSAACTSAQSSPFIPAAQRRADFEAFCRFVAEDYAYFDRKVTDWTRACAQLGQEAAAATDRSAYIGVLERALRELYDAHAHLGTNTDRSPRLVPSQADVIARWQQDRAVVTDVRRGSAATRAGVHAGDEVLSIGGVPVAAAANEFAPRFLTREDGAARDWALAVALAGRHDTTRMELVLRTSGRERTVAYAPSFPNPERRLTSDIHDGIASIRIHNSLGDPALVQDFDRALDGLAEARANALVIDLRDTPSGGTSSVARGILGRLVAAERPYQRHELVGEFTATGVRRIWVEYVVPRGATFRGPVVVLVGGWTGSMGEGLAIGLNAALDAPVLGRPMAGLLGALGERTLPHSGIVVRIPVEKLFHVDGRPREAFLPSAIAVPADLEDNADFELHAARARAASMRDAGTRGPRSPAPN